MTGYQHDRGGGTEDDAFERDEWRVRGELACKERGGDADGAAEDE